MRVYFVYFCSCSLFGSVSYSLRLPSFNFHIWECCRNLLSNFTRIIKYSLVSVLDWCLFTAFIYAVTGLLFPSMENIACTLLGGTSLSEIGKYLIWNETAVVVFFSVFLFPSNFLSLSVLLFLYLYSLSLPTSLPWFICLSLVPLNCSFPLLRYFLYFLVVSFFVPFHFFVTKNNK